MDDDSWTKRSDRGTAMQVWGSTRAKATLMAVAVGIATGLMGVVLPAIALPSAVPAARASIGPGECVTDVPPGSECGVLSVPETRGIEGSPTVRLPYVVVPTALRDTPKPPLVVLVGSTMFADLDVVGLSTSLGFSAERDVVFVERRGGASAKPELRCSPAVDVLSSVFAAPTPRERAVAKMSAAVEGCAKDWASKGLTPASFGVEQAAADVIDLRRELRYPSWYVYASGTAAPVGARVAALDPTGTAGLVLDTPALDAGASGSRGGAAAAPAQLTRAMAAMERHPHAVPGWRHIVLSGDTLEAVVDAASASPVQQAVLPLGLQSIAGGDTGALDAVSQSAVSSIITSDVVARWLSTCAAPYRPTPAADARTTLLGDLAAAACTGAGVPITPNDDPSVLGSTRPTLLLEERTADSAEGSVTATAFASAAVATFDAAGSPALVNSGCAAIVTRAWIADPESFRSGLCAADDAAVPVLAAADTHPSPRLAAGVATSPAQMVAVFALPVLFGVVNLLWAISWLVPTVGAVLRRQPVQDRLAAGIAPIFGSIWFIGCAVAIVRAAISSPATAMLGVPAAVPWLSVVLVVGGFGLTSVWQRAARGRRLSVCVVSALWAATAVWVAWFVFGWV